MENVNIISVMAIDILYQTDEILVVYKPCGMSCQGGEGAGTPLCDVLCRQLSCAAGKGPAVYPVHRLDRDTAGLVIVARSSASAAKWTALIARRQVRKEYAAICIGAPIPPSGTVTCPILQRTRHGVTEKNAATQYETLCSWQVMTEQPHFDTLSLVRAVLLTGRTHQIRLHMAHLSTPIVADDKHGNFALNRALRREFGVKKLCLAALRLTLPIDGETVTIDASLPPHMQMFMEAAGSPCNNVLFR